MNKREIQREGTLGLIYNTVNRLVEEKGYENIRIRDICERAGISTGAFYHHFTSKDDILYERYHATNLWMAQLFDDAAQMEPVEALLYVTTEMVEYTRTRLPDILTCYTKALMTHLPEWRQRDSEAGYLRRCIELMRKGVQDGKLSASLDCEAIAQMIQVFQRGVVMEQCMSNGAYLRDSNPELDFCQVLRARLEGKI